MRYSIIVPVYNAGEHLRNCLGSVLAQTCRDWECICVDDGSADSSPKILDEYASGDSRIRNIRQPHAGVGVARNLGMDAAVGEYVVFLDADDSLLPDALERLGGENADIVTFLPGKKSGVFDSLVGNMIAWNAMYRRDAIQGIRFPNLINCEDLVFAIEALARARTVKMDVPVWCRHNDVVGSLANSHSWRRVKDCWRSIGLMYAASRPMLKDCRLRLVMARKLFLHFLLHVAAEFPRMMFN